MPERPDTDAFCISCGDPNPVADGECIECLREDLDVVRGPDGPVDFARCAHCEEISLDLDKDATLLEAIEHAAVTSVQVPGLLEHPQVGVKTRQREANEYEVTVEVSGDYEGVRVRGEDTVIVRPKTRACDACSRRHGGYFEAIVQVRYEGDERVDEQQAGDIAELIEEEVRHAGGLSGGQSYLLKAIERHGGYDYYFGAKPVANNVARRIADMHGAELNHSTTLAGRKDGEEFHRLTIAVRIPRIRPGDVIGLDGDVIRVHERHGNRIIGREVPGGDGRTIEQRHAENAPILEPELVEVVYGGDGEGQIMVPDTYDTVQVKMPEGMEAGDELEAVYYEQQWIVVGRPGGD
jgi:nonsense-mediated mRNA decay protein 3